MVRTHAAGARGRPGRLTAALGAALLAAACARDASLPTEGALARPPAAPSRVVNPICAGGGQTHAGDTLTTSVTWQASGSPHVVTGPVFLAPGSTLTIQPGAIVCFQAFTGLRSTGGRLMAHGRDTALIVLTAYDVAQGWDGVDLQGTPPLSSRIRHAVVEHVHPSSTAISSSGHLVFVDTVVVRQSGAAVSLAGRPSRFGWSRVDTTTNSSMPAVTLGDSGRVEEFAIRGAAGVGLQIDGTTGVRVMGGRIEESGGIGIRAPNQTGIASVRMVRVVGGQSYPIEATAPLLQRLYGSTVVNQDSLKGNARDTVLMLGGTLQSTLYVRSGLPWHVKAEIVVGSGGMLGAQSTSRLVMDSAAAITTVADGRLQLRGTRTGPVVITADDPARGWRGISLFSAPPSRSYITNARIEHVADGQTAVYDGGAHPVRIDSVVMRQVGRAVVLQTSGSRLTRSRVDTTVSYYLPAVELYGGAVLESTRIRGAAQVGIDVHHATVQVLSCEVRESAMYGIVLWEAAPVHDCNLVDNGFGGVSNIDPLSTTADLTSNWWGDAAGPFGPNGDGAYGPVNYTPWRTTPYVLPYVP